MFKKSSKFFAFLVLATMPFQLASAFTIIDTSDSRYFRDTGYTPGGTTTPGVDDNRYFDGGSTTPSNPGYSTPSVDDPNYFNGGTTPSYPQNPPYNPSKPFVMPPLDDCRYFKPCATDPYPTPTPTPGPYVEPPLNDCRYFKPCNTDPRGDGGYVQPPIDDCRYFKPCEPKPLPPLPGECGVNYPRDIDGHWAEIYVRRLFDLCITEGYQDGTFRPDQRITRAELTKMALSGGGIAPNPGCYDSDCGSPFSDLDMWQGPWMRSAWDHQIVQGYRKNRFRPNQAITRAEAVKIVLASFGYGPLDTDRSFFKDVRGWSVGWIEQAHEIGLVQGIGNGNFDPNRAITRAEAAKIIAKMIEYWNTKIY